MINIKRMLSGFYNMLKLLSEKYEEYYEDAQQKKWIINQKTKNMYRKM